MKERTSEWGVAARERKTCAYWRSRRPRKVKFKTSKRLKDRFLVVGMRQGKIITTSEGY